MDNTVSGILGRSPETESEFPELPPKENDGAETAELDIETEELSNLWKTGNKGEVIRRYTEMDNEQSVKLVFAIGYEAALELAQIVDQMLEQGENPEEASTEPERVEPPAESNAVDDILGREETIPEEAAA